MFKLHKPHLSSSTAIHSGHFMVSRVDDDEDDNNDAGDDSSESERDNGQSFEIDVSNPDSVADATKSLDISYQVQSPSAKNELVTSWNDLDRPSKRPHKHHHYLTYYTNSSSSQHKADSRRKMQATGGCAPDNGPAGVASSPGVISPGSLVGPPAGLAASAAAATPGDCGPVDATMAVSAASTSRADHHRRPHGSGGVGARLAASSSLGAYSAGAASVGAPGLIIGQTAASSSAMQQADAYDEPRDLTSGDAQTHLQLVAQEGAEGANQLADLEVGQDEADEAERSGNQSRHAVTIDPSLTKLLESMSLYYSHKLTSPKWKSFKGLKLRMRHKIRLNNLIWRAWFFQCIRGREPPGCQFTAPPETDVHKKSESIVLEGKYWKRKEKAIVDEYKKWRIFHKQKSQIALGQMHCFRPSSFDWDSRVSNWASSSMYGPEYSFYTDDYDVNTDYNLDELTPIPEQLEQDGSYYQPTVPVVGQTAGMGARMIDTQPQPQQQQQQQQQPQQQPQTMQVAPLQATQQHQHQQAFSQLQTSSRVLEGLPHQHPHQHQHNQQLQRQHQHHQQQLQQGHAHLQHQQQQHHHQQALSLKADRSPVQPMPIQQAPPDQMQQQLASPQPINISLSSFPQISPHQQQQQHPVHLQQQQQSQSGGQLTINLNQQQRQPHHHMQHQQQQPVPYAFENNAIYQQLQHQHPQQLTLGQAQQVQQQQQDQSFMNQDLCSISSGASGSGSIICGGRNEQRRVCHINAEQKRRSNIKNGFDTLRSILPTINHNVNVKVSKASMLQKAAVYISTLTAEQRQQMDEQAKLRQQVESLKQSILAHQAQLPSAGGVPGSASTTSSRAREMLQEYIRRRTVENWKFWIFSLVIEPMYESYYKTVNTNTLEEAFKSMYSWLDQNCGLNSLRKDVTESLTVLSTSSNVLSTPQTLPTEAVEAVRYHQNHPQQQLHQQQHQQPQQQQQQQQHRPIGSNLSSQLIMPPTPAQGEWSMWR